MNDFLFLYHSGSQNNPFFEKRRTFQGSNGVSFLLRSHFPLCHISAAKRIDKLIKIFQVTWNCFCFITLIKFSISMINVTQVLPFPAGIYSKSTTEITEQCVKYVQNNNKDTRTLDACNFIKKRRRRSGVFVVRFAQISHVVLGGSSRKSSKPKSYFVILSNFVFLFFTLFK